MANETKIPITPKGWASGTGFSGPLYGGILLDLNYMDKILSIDPVNMKAVTEAGCSFFKLSQELYKNGMMLPTTEYSPGPNVAASAITPVNAFGKTRYGREDILKDEINRCLLCGTGKANYTGPQSSEQYNVACNNCHNCVAVCPENAISFKYYTKKQEGKWA